MSFDRRDFLKLGAGAVAGAAMSSVSPALSYVATAEERARASSKNRWGMVIDINKCDTGCDACVTACRKENNVPHFQEPELDVHWIRKINFKERGVADAEERSLPAMCFHCQHPPCAHVCPVSATFVRKDGIVLVDKHRCIGCRYCMIACPYKARSFVSRPVEHKQGENRDVPIRMHGVVEKCNLCVHRIDKNLEPACVVACREKGGGAMTFGNLKAPDSEVAQLIKTGRATPLRADLGLNPGFYYIGL